MPGEQKDNQTYPQKKALRLRALRELAEMGIDRPSILETHGGAGVLWAACYPHLTEGTVFEKDALKTSKLGKQRPTWAVYECDCVNALAHGVGNHLAYDLIDTDPYGETWPALDAYFSSQRPHNDKLVVVANDGLRVNLMLNRAWKVGSLQEAVERHGTDIFPIYLEVCEELIAAKAAKAGYQLDRFSGYYTGRNGNMTHYLAVLSQNKAI